MNSPLQDFRQEISVSEASLSSAVTAEGPRQDFGCMFIVASSGPLEQALSRTDIRTAVQRSAALTKQLHLTHKATKGMEETSGPCSRYVVASREHE